MPLTLPSARRGQTRGRTDHVAVGEAGQPAGHRQFMTRMSLGARGRASADLAWERYAVPDRWPQWAPQIQRVEASAERIAAGVTGTVFGPLGVHVCFVVDTVDEQARTWTWRVRCGPVRLRLTHTVEAIGTGCSTRLHVDGPLPIVLGYLPVAALALRRLVAP